MFPLGEDAWLWYAALMKASSLVPTTSTLSPQEEAYLRRDNYPQPFNRQQCANLAASLRELEASPHALLRISRSNLDHYVVGMESSYIASRLVLDFARLLHRIIHPHWRAATFRSVSNKDTRDNLGKPYQEGVLSVCTFTLPIPITAVLQYSRANLMIDIESMASHSQRDVIPETPTVLCYSSFTTAQSSQA